MKIVRYKNFHRNSYRWKNIYNASHLETKFSPFFSSNHIDVFVHNFWTVCLFDVKFSLKSFSWNSASIMAFSTTSRERHVYNLLIRLNIMPWVHTPVSSSFKVKGSHPCLLKSEKRVNHPCLYSSWDGAVY